MKVNRSMNKQIIYAVLLMVSYTAFSCDPEEDPLPVKHEDPAPVNENSISTDFGDNVFGSNVEIELLKELRL